MKARRRTLVLTRYERQLIEALREIPRGRLRTWAARPILLAELGVDAAGRPIDTKRTVPHRLIEKLEWLRQRRPGYVAELEGEMERLEGLADLAISETK